MPSSPSQHRCEEHDAIELPEPSKPPFRSVPCEFVNAFISQHPGVSEHFLADWIRLYSKLLRDYPIDDMPTRIDDVCGPLVEPPIQEIKLAKGTMLLRSIKHVIQRIVADAEIGPDLHFEYDENEQNEFWGAQHMKNAWSTVKELDKG